MEEPRPSKLTFIDHYKVIFCLALRVARHFQPHRRAGHQQFLAPPGVLDMNRFHHTVHVHMGNKTVRPVDKDAVCDFFITCRARSFFAAAWGAAAFPGQASALPSAFMAL